MEIRTKKVLIADDEEGILEIISYNLTKEGYEIYTAKDGNEALEKAKQLEPDLIILDVMMPYKTGIEVCQILRSLPNFQDTLIIFLTALSDEASEIKGLGLEGIFVELISSAYRRHNSRRSILSNFGIKLV